MVFGDAIEYLLLGSDELIIIYIYDFIYKNKIYDVEHILSGLPPKVKFVPSVLAPGNYQRLTDLAGLQQNVNSVCNQVLRSSGFKTSNGFIKRKPTSGLLCVLYFLINGYRNIRISGIDFYLGNPSYSEIRNELILDHTNSSHRGNPMTGKKSIYAYIGSGVHSRETDITFVSEMLRAFPDAKLTVTSCEERTAEIWNSFDAVTVLEMKSSKADREAYDAYLEKDWLKIAVDEYMLQYGEKTRALIRKNKRINHVKRMVYSVPGIKSLVGFRHRLKARVNTKMGSP